MKLSHTYDIKFSIPISIYLQLLTFKGILSAITGIYRHSHHLFIGDTFLAFQACLTRTGVGWLGHVDLPLISISNLAGVYFSLILGCEQSCLDSQAKVSLESSGPERSTVWRVRLPGYYCISQTVTSHSWQRCECF